MEGGSTSSESYHAVTGADGKFSITDVRRNYTLVATQPFTGPIEQPVTVAAGKPPI